jgi:hypothetical protein
VKAYQIKHESGMTSKMLPVTLKEEGEPIVEAEVRVVNVKRVENCMLDLLRLMCLWFDFVGFFGLV